MAKRSRQPSNQHRALTRIRLSRQLCATKTRYSTRPEALLVIKDKQQISPDGSTLTSYLCIECGGWHLTSRK